MFCCSTHKTVAWLGKYINCIQAIVHILFNFTFYIYFDHISFFCSRACRIAWACVCVCLCDFKVDRSIMRIFYINVTWNISWKNKLVLGDLTTTFTWWIKFFVQQHFISCCIVVLYMVLRDFSQIYVLCCFIWNQIRPA